MTNKKKVIAAWREMELRMQRNLLRPLFQISRKKGLDLDEVLTYPLTPRPLSYLALRHHLQNTKVDIDEFIRVV